MTAPEAQPTPDAVRRVRRSRLLQQSTTAIGEVLRSARKRALLTQREMVERLPKWLGMEHTVISKLETGKRALGLIEAREMGKVLGLTVEELDRRALQLDGIPRSRPPRKKRPG